MKLRTWFIVLGILGICVPIGIVCLCRLDAELECWEESKISPTELLRKSDYVALAEFQSYRILRNIKFQSLGNPDSGNIYEMKYRTIKSAKGQFDTTIIWGFISGEIVNTSLHLGDTTLVYGRIIENKDSIPQRIFGGIQNWYDSSIAEGINHSSELKLMFDSCKSRNPILGFTEGGHVYWIFLNGNYLCYEDDNSRAHVTYRTDYWKEIMRIKDKK
jgi:hypothetical protein